MNFKRKLLILFLAFIIFPCNALAYSKYLVPGGMNIGINILSNGILVVGFYDTKNTPSDLKIGDVITSINDKEVSGVSDMLTLIDTSNDKIELEIGYKRNGELRKTKLELEKDKDGVFKTGLYVKDTITGIGTLTFIEPSTNKYGALGHPITDNKTNIKFDIKDGKIFKADVLSIDKSTDFKPGEKNAKFYFDTVYGNILQNEDTGIYGEYKSNYDSKDLVEVGEIKDIKEGKAIIKTTLEGNKVEDFNIEILNVDADSDTKNILFKITDEKLLQKTGGIVKGMSGSPIIQNGKIIGAVTHTVVSDNTKGYGISIIKMLESME